MIPIVKLSAKKAELDMEQLVYENYNYFVDKYGIENLAASHISTSRLPFLFIQRLADARKQIGFITDEVDHVSFIYHAARVTTDAFPLMSEGDFKVLAVSLKDRTSNDNLALNLMFSPGNVLQFVTLILLAIVTDDKLPVIISAALSLMLLLVRRYYGRFERREQLEATISEAAAQYVK